jgi:hypothetical protein
LAGRGELFASFARETVGKVVVDSFRFLDLDFCDVFDGTYLRRRKNLRKEGLHSMMRWRKVKILYNLYNKFRKQHRFDDELQVT